MLPTSSKLLVISLAVCLASAAEAQTSASKDPPPYIKDAVIEVRLKSGDLYAFPGKDWMVVRRDSIGKTEAQACPTCRACDKTPIPLGAAEPKNCPIYVPSQASTKAEVDTLRQKVSAQDREIARLTALLTAASNNANVPVAAQAMESASASLNRIVVTAGLGIQYAIVQDQLGSYLDSTLSPVVGVEYQRVVYENYSVMISVASNQTYLLGIGYDW